MIKYAVLIDRKGFQKMLTLPDDNPPPPVYIMPIFDGRPTSYSALDSLSQEPVEFKQLKFELVEHRPPRLWVYEEIY